MGCKYRQPQRHRRIKILQQRACFTELSVSELDQHSETFGPVALAFDIGHLRDAGALPVIYAPQGSEKLLSQLSTFAVRGAYHTIGVLEILERLENRSNPKKAMERGHPLQPDEKITLERRDPSSGKVVVENDVSLSSIHQILGHVGYRNIPFDHSVGVLRLLQHIFYPTDNAYTGDQLGYYRQREWRLVGGGLHYENRPLARNLTQSEQARLLAIDEQF